MGRLKKYVTLALIPASFAMGLPFPAHAAGKDRGKAFVLSLLVPGAGQYYAGSPGAAKLFFAAEIAVWGGYYYNTSMKQSRREDYLLHAALHAGASPAGRGTAYLNALGAFNSSFDSNAYQLAIKANPVLYTGNAEWHWDSEVERIRFRTLRESELDYENTIKYCIAGAVLNHLLAALHAANLTARKPGAPSLTFAPAGRGLAAVYARSF